MNVGGSHVSTSCSWCRNGHQLRSSHPENSKGSKRRDGEATTDRYLLQEAKAVLVHNWDVSKVYVVHLHLLTVQHLEDDHPVAPDALRGDTAHLAGPHKYIQQLVALAHLWACVEGSGQTEKKTENQTHTMSSKQAIVQPFCFMQLI